MAAKWFDEAAAKAAKNEAEGKSNMMSYRTYFEKLAKDPGSLIKVVMVD